MILNSVCFQNKNVTFLISLKARDKFVKYNKNIMLQSIELHLKMNAILSFRKIYLSNWDLSKVFGSFTPTSVGDFEHFFSTQHVTAENCNYLLKQHERNSIQVKWKSFANSVQLFINYR